MKTKFISTAILFFVVVFTANIFHLFFSSSPSSADLRPSGFMRLTIPKDSLIELKLNNLNLPFNFIHSSNGYWINKSELGWGDIFYPFCNGRIQITHKTINGNLSQLIDDAHKMTFKHSIVAEGIDQKNYVNSERNVNGMIFRIYGNTASSIQFFATDSISNFIRGAAYIYAQPNPDSLKPINEFLEQEVITIMESIYWNSYI